VGQFECGGTERLGLASGRRWLQWISAALICFISVFAAAPFAAAYSAAGHMQPESNEARTVKCVSIGDLSPQIDEHSLFSERKNLWNNLRDVHFPLKYKFLTWVGYHSCRSRDTPIKVTQSLAFENVNCGPTQHIVSGRLPEIFESNADRSVSHINMWTAFCINYPHVGAQFALSGLFGMPELFFTGVPQLVGRSPQSAGEQRNEKRCERCDGAFIVVNQGAKAVFSLTDQDREIGDTFFKGLFACLSGIL
jgi:hypothetical protein